MDAFWQDLRYALRTLARKPGFTFVAVMILGLAIGATTAIFSVVNAVLLRPLPYKNPDRLVAVSALYRPGKTNRVIPAIVATELEQWAKETHTLAPLASFTFTALPVRVGNQAFYPTTALVDADLLTALGIAPLLGRNFDVVPGNAKDSSIILAHKLWMEAFGGDPAVVGKPIIVDGDPYTVVGVLPASFQFPRSDASYSSHDVEMLMPAKSFPNFPRTFRNWFAIGRLRPGVTLAQAQAEMQALALRTGEKSEEGRDWSVQLDPLGAATSRSARRALLLILGISIVLLLIACTNIMNLFFSRAATRTREMAVRKAVGATTGRLIRQLLTESGCVAALAGVVGLGLASISLDAIAGLSPYHLPISGKISLDTTVLGFAFLICALAAVVAGLFPALRTSLQREDVLRSSGTRVSGGRFFGRMQRALAVTQMALGLGLLAAAGLLVNSLWRMSSVDPGFVHEGVLGFTVSIPEDHSSEQIPRVYQRMLDEIRDIPGVSSAGMVTFLPPELRSGVFGPFKIADQGASQVPGNTMFSNTLIASEGYFQTLGIPLMQGRDFTPRDTASSPKVIMVNETLARRFFPKGDALGRHVRVMFDGDGPSREIIGIVKDVHDRGLGSNTVPTTYTPMTQFALPYGSVAVRTHAPLPGLIPEIRSRIAKVDASVPLTEFQTLDDRIRQSLEEPRFYTVLATVCALMAVLFVTLGLYGLIAFSVSQRTSEIGIRMALGAQRGMILRMVLGQGLGMAAMGVGIGIALSLAFTRLLQNLLFEIKPNDPLTLIAASAFLAGVALLASYIPAQRASRVDPMIALRYE
jgi:predicted permease